MGKLIEGGNSIHGRWRCRYDWDDCVQAIPEEQDLVLRHIDRITSCQVKSRYKFIANRSRGVTKRVEIKNL